MAGEPYLAISSDANCSCTEAAHGDARLVKRRNPGQQGGAQRGSGRRRQGPARQDGAERNSLVGFYGNPQAVRIRAPGEHWREGGMAVLEQPLDTRHRARSLRRRDRDFVYYNGLSVLEHGLPALAHARINKLDQPRFGLTLGHIGEMVTLPDVAYVIVQPCVGVKDASCVEVCPVDCIHTDDAATMYFIDPDECIDCGACVDPCPVDAIFPEDEVPEQWRDYIKINADYFKTKQ